MKTKGTKYHEVQNCDVAEIAKRIRQDLKAGQKAGQLDKSAKFSVKIRRFSGGQSVDVEIVKVDFLAINFEAWKVLKASDYTESWADHGGRLSRKASDLKLDVEQIVQQYNRADVDSQSDYHNTNFFYHVEFDDSFLSSQFEETLHEASPAA